MEASAHHVCMNTIYININNLFYKVFVVFFSSQGRGMGLVKNKSTTHFHCSFQHQHLTLVQVNLHLSNFCPIYASINIFLNLITTPLCYPLYLQDLEGLTVSFLPNNGSQLDILLVGSKKAGNYLDQLNIY